MPELDKNYLAGLYLDEITLDVMPQEYIDAALEVKLRYDACAPRAGYVCVQDRRVKGGFYYRKAPQGQGVNALPPSKLERVLARSQEESRPRSEIRVLGKAAIGAGLAIGGLALTGAVVNAGRSSEPYQEPVRQRPTPPPSNTARNVAVGVGAAATVGLGVGAAIANKSTPPANTDIKEVEPNVVVNPKTSASTEVQKTQALEEVASTEREQGRKEQEARNEAIKQTVEVAIPRTISAYENTLAVKYSRQGGLKEGKEKAAQYKPEGDENFVRLFSLQYSIEKKEPTKASIARTSEDLQKMYDKLKEYGLEDSIEFRKARSQARGREGQELTSTSSNPYTIKINGVSENVGEIRFTRSQKDIQDAIAEKIKNPQAQSQSPQQQVSDHESKSANILGARITTVKAAAKLPDPADLSKNPEWVKGSIVNTVNTVSETDRAKIIALSQTKTAKEVAREMGLYETVGEGRVLDEEKVRAVRAFYGIPSLDEKQKQGSDHEASKIGLIDRLSAKLSKANTSDGFVAQSGLITSLKSNPNYRKLDLDNEVDNLVANSGGRLQQTTNASGVSLVRDLDQVKTSKLVAEAKKIKDPESGRIDLLKQALEYKEAKATSDEEKAGVTELRAAIAGIQEVKPEPRKDPKSKPKAGEDRMYGGRSETNKGNPESVDEAERMGLVSRKPDSVGVRSVSDEEAFARTQKDLEERKAREESTTRAATGIPTRPNTYTTPLEQVKIEAKKLAASLDQSEDIDPKAFNRKVGDLRSSDTVKQYVSLDEQIRAIKKDYAEKIDEEKLRLGTARPAAAPAIRQAISDLKAAREKDLGSRKRQIYKELGIPDLQEEKKKQASSPSEPSQEQPPAADTAGQDTTRSQEKKTPTAKDKPVIEVEDAAISQQKSVSGSSDSKSRLKEAITYKPLSLQQIAQMPLKDQEKYHSSFIQALNEVGDMLRDGGKIEQAADILSQVEEQRGIANNEIRKITNLGYKDESDLSGDLIKLGQDPMYTSSKEDKIKVLLPFVTPEGEVSAASQSPSAPAENPPASTKKRSRSSKSANTATSTEKSNAVSTTPKKAEAEIDLKTLQANISRMESTAKTLEETLARIQSGKKPLKASQSALSSMGIDIAGFGALDSAKQISKLQKAITYQREQIQKKQQEGRDFVDKLLQNNDAIAPSEVYLSAYWEIRNKYRRAS